MCASLARAMRHRGLQSEILEQLIDPTNNEAFNKNVFIIFSRAHSRAVTPVQGRRVGRHLPSPAYRPHGFFHGVWKAVGNGLIRHGSTSTGLFNPGIRVLYNRVLGRLFGNSVLGRLFGKSPLDLSVCLLASPAPPLLIISDFH
ncbi:hypothetical protein CDD83_3744 [Cordyceps sp. RAO-2017]|nr:hypothetical protein CDD83_3744 [Cordyceps sp. RAO-2017]